MARRAKGFYIKSDLTNEIKKAASDIGKYGDGAQRRMKTVIRKGTQDALSAAKSKAPIATGGIVKRLVMEYDEKNNRGFVKTFHEARARRGRAESHQGAQGGD